MPAAVEAALEAAAGPGESCWAPVLEANPSVPPIAALNIFKNCKSNAELSPNCSSKQLK
jgi:hypothetical protein